VVPPSVLSTSVFHYEECPPGRLPRQGVQSNKGVYNEVRRLAQRELANVTT